MDTERLQAQAEHLGMTLQAFLERRLVLQNQAWWLENSFESPGKTVDNNG